MGRGGQARASSGLVAAVLGSGNDTRIAIGVGLSQAGAPDFELNLGGPKGVREALAQTDSSLKAALLQALRWRVLRRSGAGQGKAVVDYVDADVLDAHAGCGLVHSLLSSPHARVQQQAARFLECLSRQAQGRAYLMSGNGRLLEQVTTAIKGIQGDTRLAPVPSAMLAALACAGRGRRGGRCRVDRGSALRRGGFDERGVSRVHDSAARQPGPALRRPPRLCLPLLASSPAPRRPA